MIVRYVPAKVFGNYAMAIVAGAAVVAVFAVIGLQGTIVGAATATVVLAILLLLGALKRAGRKEPILTFDEAGLTVHLPGIGLIPWNHVRRWDIKGAAWLTGVRLIVDYAGGERPAFGFMAKLAWAVQPKRHPDGVRLILGGLDQTDTTRAALEAALARYAPDARV